jgi:hypothetical protein
MLASRWRLLIRLYMCPYATICLHATIYVSSCYYICVLRSACMQADYVCSYGYIRVLILLHTCPHTTVYVSSYYYICVLTLLHIKCPRTTIHVSAYDCMCPHTPIHVSSYYCKRDLMRVHLHAQVSMQASRLREARANLPRFIKYKKDLGL